MCETDPQKVLQSLSWISRKHAGQTTTLSLVPVIARLRWDHFIVWFSLRPNSYLTNIIVLAHVSLHFDSLGTCCAVSLPLKRKPCKMGSNITVGTTACAEQPCKR